MAALVGGITLAAGPAEARRVSIDDNLNPSFLLPNAAPTGCSISALCFSGELPYSLDLGGGQSSKRFFVNNDGVTTFGTEFHDYTSLFDLHAAGVDFAAPVYAEGYGPGFARFGVTTEQDIRNIAAYKLTVCQFFSGGTEFLCKENGSVDEDVPFFTVDEFIAANHYDRYLGDVVIQSGASYVVLSRTLGADAGVATLYSDDMSLDFDYGITRFQTDFDFSGQHGGSDSFTYAIQASVPEPATWWMMIVGFGLLGGALRASRRGVKLTYA